MNKMFPMFLVVCLCVAGFLPGRAQGASGNVGDPQIMTDHPFYQGELAYSSFDRLFKSQADLYTRVTGRKVDNPEDKALASWFWRSIHYFHCTELGEPDVWEKGRSEVVRDYWAGLFSYGHGMCQETHYQYTAEMEYLLGHCCGRACGLNGHTSFEVWLNGGAYGAGKWALLDQDITAVCFDEAQKVMLNIEEIKRKQPVGGYLTNRTAKDNRGWLPELYPGDGGLYWSGVKFYAPLSGYACAAPVVNLRPGETMRRFPRPGLGDGSSGKLAFWGICVDGMDGPNRNITYINEPDKFFNATERASRENDPAKRARFGNARFIYKPDFKGGSYQDGVAAEDDTSVTFEHVSPYIIAAKPPNKNGFDKGCSLGLVLNGKADCKVAISIDNMKTFTDPVDFKDGLDLTDIVKGHYQYWLKFMSPAKALAGKDVTITTCCMANGYVMPWLKANGSQVTFNASGLAVETIGPQFESIRQNIVDGALDKDTFVVKMKTPHGEKVKSVSWATRSFTGCPPRPELAFKAEYSVDGKEWKVLRDDWHITPPPPYDPPDTWSQSFFFGTKDIASDGANEVRVRISNNKGKGYLMGQFSLVYETKNTAQTKVTYCWDEAGKEKTEFHVYPASAKMDTSWKIKTGVDPKLKWVEMEPVTAK